jgi:hypothetical protein
LLRPTNMADVGPHAVQLRSASHPHDVPMSPHAPRQALLASPRADIGEPLQRWRPMQRFPPSSRFPYLLCCPLLESQVPPFPRPPLEFLQVLP